MAKKLVCKKCKGENIHVDFVKNPHRSSLLGATVMAPLTLGISLAGHVASKKEVKVAICNDCGYSWQLKK